MLHSTTTASTHRMRFKPDPLDTAAVDLNPKTGSFKPSLSAMIMNESFTGCALILHTADELMPERIIRVKVGRMEALRAQIAWVKRIDTDLLKVGIMFLE